MPSWENSPPYSAAAPADFDTVALLIKVATGAWQRRKNRRYEKPPIISVACRIFQRNFRVFVISLLHSKID
ncbi:hypothetical protein AKG12_15420 [Agrobacterium sp. SUL3]|nr:hypothetical protein AKG12_15420 [Agrobacterium sp. SUL3]